MQPFTKPTHNCLTWFSGV